MDARIKRKIDTMAQKSRETAENPLVKTYTSIFMTFDMIENYVRASLKNGEVSRAGMNVLHILIMHGGNMIATEISKHVWRSKYATIRVIDTLEKGGYVTRGQPDSNGDRRKKMITITPKGIALSKKTEKVSTERLCQQVMDGLTGEQIASLYEILEHIRKHTFDLIEASDNSYIYRNP